MLFVSFVLALVLAIYEPDFDSVTQLTFVAYGLALVPFLFTASVVLIIVGSALTKADAKIRKNG